MRAPDNEKLSLIIFLTASFLIFTSFYATFIILPLHTRQLGGTEFQVGLQTTLFFLVGVLLRLYLGPLADKRGIRIPLLIGFIAFATAPFLFLLSQNIWTLTLARLYQALGLAAIFPCGSILTALLAAEERRGMYLGLYHLSKALSLMIGPLGATAIQASYGLSALYKISLGTGLLALLLVIFVKIPRGSAPVNIRFGIQLQRAIKAKNLWPIFQATAVSSTGLGILLTFTLVYITAETELSYPGLYFTFFSAAGICAAIAAGILSDRWGREVVLYPLLILLGTGIGLLFWLPDALPIFFASSILTGTGSAGVMAVSAAWIIDTANIEMRATAVSIKESVIDLSIGLGTFFFGFLSSGFGLKFSFSLVGFLVFCFGFFNLKRARIKQR